MESYTKKERNFYLLGLAGQNLLYGAVTSCLAYYLQFTILIPAALVGVIVSASRIFDAVKDPLMGAVLSRSSRQFRDWLRIIPIPTGVLTVLCFTNGIWSNDGGGIKNALIVTAAFVCFLLWETVFTLGDIPLTGYPSLMTENETDRNKLLSLRPVGALSSSISSLTVQPLAFALAGILGGTAIAERNAFFLVVLAVAVIGGALFQLTGVKTKQRILTEPEHGATVFRYFRTNPLLRKILISGILGSLRSMPGVILTPLVTYYFANKNAGLTLLYTVLFGAGNFFGMLASMVLVPKLTKKHGTVKVFVGSNLLTVLPNVLLFGLYLCRPQSMTDPLPLTLMVLLTLFTGGGISLSTTVQPLMIGEAVDLEYQLSGNRPTALFFSAQTFIVKIGTGLSSLVASLAYSLIHFSSAETAALNAFIAGGGVTKLEGSYSLFLWTLFFLYTIPTAVSALLAILPYTDILQKEKRDHNSLSTGGAGKI